MKLNLSISILIAVATFTSGQCSLAEDAPSRPLTLQQARDIAVANHPRITEAELLALASNESVRESRSAFFPVIAADATAAGAAQSNTRIAAGGLNNSLILDRQADGVNFRQLITDFGRTANLTGSAKLQAQAQAQHTLATRAQVLLAVDAAYFSALQAQSILEVAKQTVATRQLTFNQVDEMAKSKLRSGLDVSFARVDLQSSQLLLANANHDVQSAFATLANVLGLRNEVDYRLMEEPMPSVTNLDDSQLLQTALANRPDLAQLRFGHDAALKFARAEKDLNYPTVNAFGAAGFMPIHDEGLRENYAAAGVNIDVPIFDGMLYSAREKEAQLRAKASAENLRDAENNVIRDVRIARLNLDYAGERLTLTAQLLASANEAFELAQARLNAGSTSIVELSQAQLNLTEAQIAQARAKYDFQTRNTVLNYQLGILR